MTVEELLLYFFKYFSLTMLIAAVVAAVINRAVKRATPEGNFWEHLFRWTSFLAAGVVGFFTFAFHVFDPERAAQVIGWQTSPFQYEVGIADLVAGVLGVLAFWGSHGFRLAATIGIAVWLWGDAVGHVRQIILAHNYEPGNAGPWLWTDVLVPAVMIVALCASGRSKAAAASGPRRTVA